MKSAQVLSRLQSISHDIGDGHSQSLEDDVLSLNSWSDEIIHHNQSRTRPTSSVRRTRSISAASLHSSTVPNSNSVNKGDSASGGRHQDIHDKRNSLTGDNLRKNKRGSTSSDHFKRHGCGESNEKQINATADSALCAQTKTKDLDGSHRNTRGRATDCDDLVHSSSQTNFPLSLDLKSACFEYPSLWENPLPPSPQLQSHRFDFEHHHTKGSRIHSSKLKARELLSPQSSRNAQSLKLYPNLGDSKVTDISDNHKVLRQSDSSSKTSPSRPQFFDYSRSSYIRASRQRDSNESIPSSSVDPKISLCPSSFTSADARAQNHIDQAVTRQSYFKSQPAIPPKRSGFSLRFNNSSNDLESLNNKQNLEHLLERENVKSKVMTVWNNIKYGWTFKPKSTIRLDSPLFLLGKVYHKRSDVENEEPEFLDDFTSRIWFTYRSNFYPIPGTKLTTDCGWGCMLRSGQMLVAQCFISHFLGREWRLQSCQSETQLLYYREILRWFSDPVEAPSDKVPFSLHNLVKFGRNHNKIPGEWYGPGSVAYIFRDALTRASLSLPILKDVCIYVAQDCTVYIDDVNELCSSRPKSESGASESNDQFNTQHSNDPQYPQSSTSSSSGYNTPWCRSLIMLIPVRLGGESMNEIYTPCIKSLLSYPHCMGIIGGKPKHSLYFIGWQDNKLIYLDPHYCRETVDTTHKNFSIETFHCTSPRKLSINKMDPSCTVGFYIKDSEEFKKFVHDVTEFVSPPHQRGLYPLFIFSNGSQKDADLANGQIGTEQGRVKVKHYVIDENGQRHRTMTRESEEFIML